MKLIRLLSTLVFIAALSAAAQAPSRWAQPAAALAGQIADLMGPGQARIALRNLSTIPLDQLPAIQRLIEQDLKARGIVISGDESANTLRITLSENASERLWIAEIIEGKDVQIAMVHLDRDQPHAAATSAGGVTLRKQIIATLPGLLLSVLEIPGGLIALEPENVVVYGRAADGWREQNRLALGPRRPLPRDPRGMLVAHADGAGFDAYLSGAYCSGSRSIAPYTTGWSIDCHESDDPWPILQNNAITATSLRAFYNAGRNYFTGIVTPNLPVDLPPFYAAALVPRAAGGVALLINGVDGKVQIIDNNTLKPVAGTRDWGSDFAALSSGCSVGTQIVASSSGAAANDSLRAYELPALEAVPAGDPLAMDGTVTALSPASDGKSLLVITQTGTDQYEVDRVTATCN